MTELFLKIKTYEMVTSGKKFCNIDPAGVASVINLFIDANFAGLSKRAANFLVFSSVQKLETAAVVVFDAVRQNSQKWNLQIQNPSIHNFSIISVFWKDNSR